MSSLAGLTINSKPIINMLTSLASENVSAASSVAAAIERHISTVRAGLRSCSVSIGQALTLGCVDQCSAAAKLPGLYLIDSIVKNHKEPFVSLFARNLPLVSPQSCPTLLCWLTSSS